MKKKNITNLLNLLELVAIFSFLFFSFSDDVDVVPVVYSLIRSASYIIVLILIIKRWRQIAYILTRDISLTLLVVLTILSIFWSVNLSVTSRQNLALLRTTLIGVYFAIRYSRKDQMRILFWLFGAQIVVNLLVLVALPSHGWVTDELTGKVYWNGIYTFKQSLGHHMSIAASFYLANISDKQQGKVWLTRICLISSLLALLISTSKTYLLSFVASALLQPIRIIIKQRFRVKVLMICFLLITFVTISFLCVLNWQLIVVDILGKDTQLNGRTPIWEMALQKLRDRPFLGYGYAAFWASEHGRMIAHFTPWLPSTDDAFVKGWHAHNGFLDLSLQIGLIGVLLLIINIFLVSRRLYNLLIFTKKPESLWMFMFVINDFCGNLSEAPTYLSYVNFYWVIYVAIAYSSAIEVERIKKSRNLTLLNISTQS